MAKVVSRFIRSISAVRRAVVHEFEGNLRAVEADIGAGEAVFVFIRTIVAVIPIIVHVIDGQFLILSIVFTHDRGRGFESKGGGVNAAVEAVVFLAGVPVFGGAASKVEVVFIRAVHAVFVTVVDVPRFNHLTAVAHEPVLAIIVTVKVATFVNAKPILDEFAY